MASSVERSLTELALLLPIAPILPLYSESEKSLINYHDYFGLKLMPVVPSKHVYYLRTNKNLIMNLIFTLILKAGSDLPILKKNVIE